MFFVGGFCKGTALTHKRPQGSEYVYSRKSMELESDSCCCASSLLRAMLAQIGKQEVFNIQMTTNTITCQKLVLFRFQWPAGWFRAEIKKVSEPLRAESGRTTGF